MSDQQLGRDVGEWLRVSCVPATDPREGVRHVAAQTSGMSQVGTGWLSRATVHEVVPIPTTNGRQPAWGFTMFSAVKFVAAGVIVALFGGFLLAGILTTQPSDEMTPAVVTESPSPMTTEELLSGMVTEEIEPGVFRVVNDGVRDLSVPLGGWGVTGFTVGVTPDGSVWLSARSGRQGLFRLGEEPVFEDLEGSPPDREVAPDGSLWAIGDAPNDRSGIFSFDGEAWTARATTTDGFVTLAVGPDGTVWVVVEDEDKHCPDIKGGHCPGIVLMRFEDDGSLTTIGDWADVYDGDAAWHQLAVAPDGDVWLVGTPRYHPDGTGAELLLRFDGEGWEAIPGPEGWTLADMGRYLEVGPEGALWVKARATGGLARFDDSGWTTFTEADGLQPWGDAWFTTLDLLEVAADGSLWLNGGSPDEGYPGVTHFDGTTSTSYLAGTEIHDFAIAPDGSVWLGATDGTSPLHLYVITPEAVAAREAEVTEPPAVEVTTDTIETATTTEELLSGMVTEEVEPGVLWVVNDGKSDFAFPVDPEVPYDIVAGHDGGVYVLEPGHYARLGEGGGSAEGYKGFGWDLADGFPSDVGVAPDGTVWAVFESPGGSRLYSKPWGSGHETRHLPTMIGPEPIEVTSDGTVWAVWLDDSETVFGYLGAEGWTVVGEWPFDGGYLNVSDRGDAWAVIPPYSWGFSKAHRFVDGAWRNEEGGGFEPGGWGFLTPADVGVDGTFWGIREQALVRFDGTEWTAFEPPGWSQPDVAMRQLAEDGWVPDHLDGSLWGEPHVAPDGSLWVPSQLGVYHRDGDLGGGRQVVCGHGIDGVARFDGETWSRFLPGHCAEAMDIAADGSVWVLASKSDARFPLAHLYVITPEAVAASE